MTSGGEWDGGTGSAPAIRAVAALEDGLRRRMYAYCRQAGRPVTRDEAAAHVGISRKLAAFHLDKLVDAGLLRAHYAQVGGIRRVGRAPKVYEPTNEPVRISIPQRRHELLAELLLDAVLQERTEEPAAASALRVARDRGERVGAEERATARLGRLGAERALTIAEAVLARHGFEPHREGPGSLRLRNCPFHPLAAKAPELVWHQPRLPHRLPVRARRTHGAGGAGPHPWPMLRPAHRALHRRPPMKVDGPTRPAHSSRRWGRSWTGPVAQRLTSRKSTRQRPNTRPER